MAKRPYIQFYIGDYIKDTRVLPLNVRGAWVDLILFMWENNPAGEVSGDINDFSRMMNCSVEEATKCLSILKEKNIFSYQELGGGIFKVISRKQKKMTQLSETRKKTGSEGGNPKLGSNYNKPGYVYAMQRSSDGWIKIGISNNPNKRIYKVREQYKTSDIFIIGDLYVTDMGVEEAKIHSLFVHKKSGEWFNLDQKEVNYLLILLKVKNNSPLNSPKGDINLNAEYEYEDMDRIGVQGKGKDGWVLMPGPDQIDLGLPEIKAGSALQLCTLMGNKPTMGDMFKLWEIFKVQNFTGSKFYQSANDVYSHFINWSKTQKINGTISQSQQKSDGPTLKKLN